MKIQELAIIFIIIILPISLILSVYTQSQIQTLNIQTLYDTKLTSATFDAIKAFQLNTANSTMSNLANSKIRDLEASISAFKTSIASAFNMTGISEEEMNEYIPALVYTMYDGFYVYSPYINKNDLGINNDGEVVYGLQPYVSYTCRYKWDNNDVIINYSLDNYITIKGMINGKYITDEGYLIDGIQENTSNGVITYNGVEITAEKKLTENVGGIEYPYRKINGTKYYYDSGETSRDDDDSIFYLSNGTKVIQGGLKGPEALQYYNSVIKNNTSALQYYKSAMKFTERAKSYGLANITYDMAYDEDGNKIWNNDTRKIFDFNNGVNLPSENIECELSDFTQHKLAIIKYVIQRNLSEVIANYNNFSAAIGIDFQIPELKADEWDSVIKNISLISFVQGVPIGGKIYNGYTIVNNTESKEVVKEDDIYIIGYDKYYHKIGDQYINDEANIADNIPAGRLKLDFRRTSILDKNNENIYYYPREEFASYDSVVMQNSSKTDTYDDIYKYVAENAGGKLSDSLQEEFYLAVGRERKGVYKFSSPNLYEYDVLVVGYAPVGNDRTTITKEIADKINENEQMNACYIFSNNADFLVNYMNTQKEHYQLIIVDSFAWSFPNKNALTEIQKYTHLITIGNDESGLPLMESYFQVSATSEETPQWTDFGKNKIGRTIGKKSDISRKVIKFNNDVKTLYTNTYTGAVTGTYDAIGYCKNGSYRWIHSQIALGLSTDDYEVIEKLALLALNGDRIYTLSFNANGGTMNSYLANVYNGEEMELPIPTRDGYEFMGWQDSAGNKYSKEEIYKVESSDEFTAIWEKVFTINLEPRGGDVSPGVIKGPLNQIITPLPMPYKENSEFMYWVAEDGTKYSGEGRTDYKTEYTITESETLYAKWKHSIIFKPNGGSLPSTTVIEDKNGNPLPKTGGGINLTILNPVPEGTQIVLPSATRDNYIFAGWIDKSGKQYNAGDYYLVEEVDTLEALWLMQIDKIDWTQDVDPYIGSLKLEENGTKVTMEGNPDDPGKNAIWTSTEEDIRTIQFDYEIDFGDSFNAAGLLLSVEELENGNLTGYMLSFNNTNVWSGKWSGSKGSIWKFTYDMVNSSNMIKEHVDDLEINISGTLKIDMSDGVIKISGGGLQNTVTINDTKINRKAFGFFSDHYDHGCPDTGYFKLWNIKVFC